MAMNLRLVFKRILFIFIFLFSISPYSYSKELKELRVKLVIEYFWDHYYEPSPTYVVHGTTNYTAIYDGKLQELREEEGFRYSKPGFNMSYGVSGNFKAHYSKKISSIARDEYQNIVMTSDASETGKDQQEYKFMPEAQSNPYPILSVKFLDKNKARYILDIYTPDLQYSYKDVITVLGLTERVEEERTRNITQLTSIFLSLPSGVAEGEYAPDKGIISGNKIWKYDLREFGSGHGYTRLSWYIGTEPPEVTIEPRDRKEYEEWLPKGGRDSNILGFIVKSSSKTHFELELTGVSNEKGICLNNPNPYLGLGDADKSFDLRFDPEDNPHLIIDPSGQKAVSRNETESLEVVVRSEDYGSFGAIKADAVFNKGESGEFRFPAIYDNGNRSISIIHIPDDSNNNKIPDAWEKEKGVEGYLPIWDDDPEPAGQKRNGDGFSLYEEYRGFYVKGNHQRLEPNAKELFIYDPDGIAQGSFFEKASGIKVYYINLEEMSGTGSYKDNKRWMNFNADSFSVSPQYGLHVVQVNGIEYIDEKQENVRTGTTIIEEGESGESPKHAMLIKIYPDGIDNVLGYLRQKYAPEIRSSLKEWKEKGKIDDIESYLKNEIVTDYMKFLTTHELGHAVGIGHHKRAGFEPFSIETVDPRAAGDIRCVMRYLSSDYKDSTTEEYKYFLNHTLTFILNPEFRSDTFCKENNNCFGQINVKD